MEYVKTGITEFDHLFAHGGYPKNNTILVLGGPGSGKSIFGMQFIYMGATLYDEAGVFVTLEETPEKIRRNMASFGWDIAELEESGKISILDAVSSRIEAQDIEMDILERGFDVETMATSLDKHIKRIGARRVVIDSLAVMGMYAKSEFESRTKLLRLIDVLSQKEVTSLVITEARTSEIGVTEFPPETFMFDGVISMRLNTDTQERKIAIRKMRGTKHVLGTFNFNIEEGGISVRP
ncbi:MAG: ATPase [Euryarchaeota archaeon]|nr:ATPase [Euryarchaeota archaeon]